MTAIIIAGVLAFSFGYIYSSALRSDLKSNIKTIERIQIKTKIGNNEYGWSGNAAVDGANALQGKNIQLDDFRVLTTDEKIICMPKELFQSIQEKDILVLEKADLSGSVLSVRKQNE